MTTYRVMLEKTRRGATVGSTDDLFDAVDMLAAEAAAVEAWTQHEPACTFRPLLTLVADSPQSVRSGGHTLSAA